MRLRHRFAVGLVAVAAAATTTLTTTQIPAPSENRTTTATETATERTGPETGPDAGADTELVAAPARARVPARATTRYRAAVNTNSAAAVRQAYRTRFKNAAATYSYTGALNRCRPGKLTQRNINETIRALNFVRLLAGLQPVAHAPARSAPAQRTALLMDANFRLSHYPARSWRCWTQPGSNTAAKSILALTSGKMSGKRAVQLYMDDPGATNKAVGHRRWILNPDLYGVGVGGTNRSSAIDIMSRRKAPGKRANPYWVQWPTKGYFPRALEPRNRWSLSSGMAGVNFRHARITVTCDGRRVGVTKHKVVDGYGKNTLAWQMKRSVRSCKAVRVKVTHIRDTRAKKWLTHSYVVRFINA